MSVYPIVVPSTVQQAIDLAATSQHPQAAWFRRLFEALLDSRPHPVDDITIHLGYWDAGRVLAVEAIDVLTPLTGAEPPTGAGTRPVGAGTTPKRSGWTGGPTG